MQNKNRGFSLLETLLAVVIIVIAGLGVYGLFNSGLSSSKISDATDEMVEIANVYTDLASSDLTNSVANEASLVTVLQNSNRLPAKYFASGGMVNAFGVLTYMAATPYSFTACAPLGGNVKDASSTVVSQFCNKVQDVYATCIADTDDSCKTGELAAIVSYSLNN